MVMLHQIIGNQFPCSHLNYKFCTAFSGLPKQTIAFCSFPFQSNAANLANNVLVFMAKVQRPHYHPLYPEAVQFGNIGRSIGHEFGHTFDGTRFPLLLSDDNEQFALNVRSDCFTNQLLSYYNFEPHPAGAKMDKFQRDQVICDVAGLRSSFEAFQHQKKLRSHPPIRVKTLEQFSEDQLFFLSYAKYWCPTSGPYVEYRVVLSLRNLPEFAKTFKCHGRLSTGMNPYKRCNIWT